ncbi:MAG: type II toxin-antitoxin system HicB family antitoxin [Candidatus Diapherotrites archaeon]|nr:type II toxin-antitoxin system HicB family antitoxin [Candidatus Diapherotrites archaeon]
MKFSVVLEKEDKGYSVSCPALPGCHSQGETKKGALKNIKEAIELYVETLNTRVRPHGAVSVAKVMV